jgi:hypothetical protein
MLQQLYAAIAVVLSVGMCVAVVGFILIGRHDRDRDEEARDFFSDHGHWPDES